MNLIKVIKPFVKKYKPELLISFGISGLIGGGIMNIIATKKSVEKIDAEKERLGRPLTKKEVFKACWKYYIPYAAATAVSVPCIIVGNSVHNRRNAALMTAYTVAETSLQTFKEEAAKSMSEEKFKELENKVSQRKVDESYPRAGSQIIISEDGDSLFYDEFSGRYFKSNWLTIQRIVNELNARAISGGDTITLNDLYSEIGLETVTGADDIGWSVYDGPRGLLGISLDSCISPDNRPCGVIKFDMNPRALFA